jgi:hypothetical protein
MLKKGDEITLWREGGYEKRHFYTSFYQSKWKTKYEIWKLAVASSSAAMYQMLQIKAQDIIICY